MKHLKQTLAILLTLLMLVTAVPFAAFATGTHTHVFNARRGNAEDLKSEATCTKPAVYYLVCVVDGCGVNARGLDESKTYEVGDINPDNHPQDKHVGIETPKEATCSEKGRTAGIMCGDCGARLEEPKDLPLTNHVAKAGKEATCTTLAECKWCGHQFGELDPNNHPADQVRVSDPGVLPTCGADGKEPIAYCRACDKYFQSGAVIPATGDHKGGTATCTERAVCTVCHQAYGEVDPNNHDLERVPAKNPTCMEKGNIEYWKCKREGCGKFFSDAKGTTEITDHASVETGTVATAHESLQHVKAKEAKCNATGNIEYWKCNACNTCYKDAAATQAVAEADTVIGTIPHTWGKLTLKEGNCTNGGKAEHECTVCHTKETVTITAGQHPEEARKVTEGKPATCMEAGKTAEISCELCGAIIKSAENIDPLGHDYENAQATGKGDGTHTLLCNRCKQPSDPIPCVDEKKPRDCKCDICGQQLTHVFSEYTPVGDATCKDDGHKKAVCTVCGKEDIQIDEGSHESVAHQFVLGELEGATCITNGHRKNVCSVCGYEVTEEVKESALGHTDPAMSDWQYPQGFDCLVGGDRIKRCTRCGDIIVTERIEPRPHAEVVDPEVKKTCTVDGRTAGSHCEICGKVITEQIIFPAEGHKPDENDFTVTKNATCTETGSKTAKCAVCGETFTVTIPAAGHKYVDTVVPPTCEGAGYTLRKCSVCGVQSKMNITPATGHKMVQKITPATTEANGKVVLTCSVCGKKQADKVYRIKKIALSQTTFVRSSKAQKPSVKITDTKGNKLTKNVDYKLKYYGNRKAIGTYKVVITFMGEYKGKVTRKFKIVPTMVKGLKVTAARKSAVLTWTQNKYADVYAVYCATEKDGKYKKLGSTTKLNFTATNLTSGKPYYFKVLAVRKTDSGNYYSANYSVKGVKVK